MSTAVEAPARPSVLQATPWVAAAWAATFLCLAALALMDRAPHPWTASEASALGSLTPVEVSWSLVVVAAAVLTVAGLGAEARTPTRARTSGAVLLALGILVTVAVSDVRALAFLGYLPMTLLATVDVGPAAGHLRWDLVTDSAAAVAHAVGGVAVSVTGARLLARANAIAGRSTSWRGWARWGPPAVAIAVVVPLLYAVTRIAWVLDVPLGIRRETLADLGSARYAGLGLALFAVLGAWLTTGLLARWGERLWPWVPRIGGRPVPVAAAVVPGLLVAGAVESAGLSFWRMLLAGELSTVPGVTSDWAAWGPELFWPVWGAALAVACLAYLGRRTG